MTSKDSNFVPLKCVKIEDNNNDYYNNSTNFILNQKNIRKKHIKCKDKDFNIVDKWIARVVVKVPIGNNWHNIVTREIALLKVRYPFLTEQQLRGKALTKFGIPVSCGSIVRTGTGKITRAIAKELSRNKCQKTRIPAAFKVLNNFLPCINKFEAKPKTYMWAQKNHQSSTLCNRKNTWTGETRQQLKKVIKLEPMESNLGIPQRIQQIAKNPTNKLELLSSNTTTINNNYEQISCSATTPKKRQRNFIRAKALISQFNNTEITDISENSNTEKSWEKNKLANNYTGNTHENIKCESIESKPTEIELLTYSQMSQESKNILLYVQSKSKMKQMLKDNVDSNREKRNLHLGKNSKVILTDVADPDIIEIIPNDSDQLHFKPPPYLFSSSYARKFESMSTLNYSPPYSPMRSKSPQVKRHYNDLSIDIMCTPPKKHKFNDYHYYQNALETVTHNRIRESFNPQKLFNENNDDSSPLKIIYESVSGLSITDQFFEPKSLYKKSNNLFGESNYIKTSMSLQHSPTTYFKSLLTPDTQFSSLSICPSNETHKNPWEGINSGDYNGKNYTNSQESRTTHTITPDIDEILVENSLLIPPHSSLNAVENVTRQISEDLLNRENFPTPAQCNINFTFDINSQLQSKQKHLLSNMCCEYDRGWEKLNRVFHIISHNPRTTQNFNTKITYDEIQIGIKKAISILHKDIETTINTKE